MRWFMYTPWSCNGWFVHVWHVICMEPCWLLVVHVPPMLSYVHGAMMAGVCFSFCFSGLHGAMVLAGFHVLLVPWNQCGSLGAQWLCLQHACVWMVQFYSGSGCVLPKLDGVDKGKRHVLQTATKSCPRHQHKWKSTINKSTALLWHLDHPVAAMALNDELKKEVFKILGSPEPVNSKIVVLNQLWLKNGLASYQTLPPCKVLVHPSNRGGAMLNGHDVMAKGEKLMTQGLRQDLLESSSVAFGLSSLMNKREEQLTANRLLVEQFPSVLAPVQGDELCLSVGSSHSTSFLKAKKIGGHSGGTEVLKQILEVGWKWLVLSPSLEENFPTLPLLYSAALNSSNSAQVAATELECLTTISKYIQLGKALEAAVAETAIGEPQCKDYLDVIAHFAKLYTGGEKMPLASFLVAFSKQFGESALLGEEFMRLVTHFDFKVSGSLLPCFRVALLAAQLTSSKVVDKISKLLVKGDFDRLKSKCQKELQQAENLLARSWDLVQQAGHLEEFKKLSVYGRLCIRMVLYLCQKQKHGRENKNWKSIQEIMDQFGAEMLSPPDPVLQSNSDSQSPGPSGSKPEFQDLLQADEVAVALLQHQHLEIGSNYQNSKVGSAIFKLLEVTKDGAKFLGFLHVILQHNPKQVFQMIGISSMIQLAQVRTCSIGGRSSGHDHWAGWWPEELEEKQKDST